MMQVSLAEAHLLRRLRNGLSSEEITIVVRDGKPVRVRYVLGRVDLNRTNTFSHLESVIRKVGYGELSIKIHEGEPRSVESRMVYEEIRPF